MVRAIETALIGGGIVCLLIFGFHSWSQARVADRLVADFSADNARPSEQRASTGPSAGTSRADSNLHIDVDAIDQSSWSDARRRAFRGGATADVLGVLSIPSVNLKAPILIGIDDAALDSGIGWLDRTAAPGQDGNAAIAGHRDSFFRSLGSVNRGDEIIVETSDAYLTYRMSASSIVAPSDVSVLAASPGERTLTLITCYPFYFVGPAPERYIVRATLTATEPKHGQ